MADRDLPSDSDTSDEDFVPEGVDSDLPSEEESGPDDEAIEAGSADETEKAKPTKRKPKRTGKKSKKRQKVEEAEVKETEEEIAEKEEIKKLTEEEEKKKSDSLWADFMKDVGSSAQKRPAAGVAKVDNSDLKLSPKPTTPSSVEKEKENKVTVTKIFQFAGEEVRVTKEVPAESEEAQISSTKNSDTSRSPASVPTGRGGGTPRGRGRGGLSAVLSQIGKKDKISTLEKSKLDWDQYKRSEGIEEEIQTHNRGKDGYLEKQDFLQRTDLRQFELEKQMRASRRSSR